MNLNFPDETLVISYRFDDRIEEYCFSPRGKRKKRKWKMKWIRDTAQMFIRIPKQRIEPQRLWKSNPRAMDLAIVAITRKRISREIETAKKTIVPGVIYADSDELGLYSLPKSLGKARQRLTQPPTLPVNTQRDALPEGKTGSFCKDEKYPGATAARPRDCYRAANGKGFREHQRLDSGFRLWNRAWC